MDGALRVLLVEDDSELANLVANCLRNFDSRFQVDSIFSEDVTTKQFLHKEYEAVIYDFNRSLEMDLKILDKLQHDGHKTPVVVLARENGEKISPDLKGRVDDYIMKNSHYLEELPRVVQKTIETHRLQEKFEEPEIIDNGLHDLILKSKKRLQSMFDGIQDSIYEVNRDYRLVLANKKFAENCSSKPENLIGRHCYEVFFDTDAPCSECPARLSFQSHLPQSIERREDATKLLEMTSHPIISDAGTVESVAVHSKDVTEKKLMEKSLIQSEKMATIGLLASGIAHELRNPLNIIEMARYYLSDILQESDADIKDKLEVIQKNVHRSSKIINDLLEFSRHSDGRKKVVDLDAIIENTISLIGKELYAKNIRLSVKKSDNLKAHFNVDSLKQVLLNIFINAIQSMPAGGKLTIELQENGECVDVKVSDTGVGISEEDIPHLFSPFFTTKEVGQGTGLGLYISHIIVDRDGGKISVDSKLGEGTTFTISLPAARSEE